jgi:hypothetical protein
MKNFSRRLGVLALFAAACGSDTTGDTNTLADRDGGATGGDNGGGSPSTGGGGMGTQCTSDSDCPSLGCEGCPAARCENGRCVTAGTATGGAGNGGGSSGGAAGEPATGGSGGAAACPSAPPANASPCTPPWTPPAGQLDGQPTAHCSWGDDPRPSCRTTALCEDGAWVLTAPRCVPPLPAECAATPPPNDSSCSDTALGCWYDDGTRCSCSECAGGSPYPVCQVVDPPRWHCVDTAAGPCPYPLPQAGSRCDTPDQRCGVDCSSPIVCRDGVWQWSHCQSCCPICAAPDTPIATPEGDRPIASLRPGELAIRPPPTVALSDQFAIAAHQFQYNHGRVVKQ